MNTIASKAIANMSEATRRLNPHLNEPASKCPHGIRDLATNLPYCRRCDAEHPSTRIRQDTKPLMNKLEAEWFAIINAQFPNYPRPRAQAVTIRLANGVRYTPDFFATDWPVPMGPSKTTAWEVKGKQAWDDAIVKLKVAASTWPEIAFVLVWKESGGEWKQQRVLP
jgi:hypothetical protein